MRQILQWLLGNLNIITTVAAFLYIFIFITSNGTAVMIQGILCFVIVIVSLIDPLGSIHYSGNWRYVYTGIWIYLTIWNFEKI